MKHFITFSLRALGIITFAFCIVADAQIPKKLSYQGLLVMPSGAAAQDGLYNLQFDIYNLPTGGMLRFTETHTSVTVQRGTFSVLLGSVSTLPAIFSESLFVAVTVLAGPGISTPIAFTNRTELSSAPYALAPWVPNGDTISYSLGNVGIGTTSPASKLEVTGIIHSTIGGIKFPDGTTMTSAAATTTGSSSTTDISFAADADVNGTGEMTMATNGNERMRITNDGKIGIGTQTPSFKFDINGVLNATDIYKNGVPFSGGGSQWTTSGSDIYYNSGNIGLGTSSPTRNIHISRNDFANAQGITIENLGADNTFTGTVIEFKNPNVTAGATNGNISIGRNTFGAGVPGGTIGMQTNHPFSLRTNGLDRLYVSSSGNVGIGTTNPSDKLSIIENTNVQQSLRSTGTTTAATFRINNDADQPFDFQTFGSAYVGSRITGINAAGLNELSSQGSNGLLIRNWSSTPIYFATNSLERMRISGSGVVGIGISNPGIPSQVNKLHVVGDATGTVGPVTVVVQGSGNMSTNNMVSFQARGTVSGTEYFANFAIDRYFHSAGIGYVGSTAPGGLAFSADNTTEHLRVSPSGNVGIGTTSPASKLEVAGIIHSTTGGIKFPDGTTMTSAAATTTGSSSTTDLSFAADADANGTGVMIMATNGNERMRISNDGKVGIGTTTPTSTLDIAGDVRVSGSLRAGVWQLIYETDITTNTNGVTISGLDGDVDKEYEIITRIRAGAATGGSFFIRPNNDAGTNYGWQMFYGAGSTPTAASYVDNLGLFIGNSSSAGNLSTGRFTLYAKSGYPRTYIGEWVRTNGGAAVYAGTAGGVWNNSADNITSLTIYPNITDGIGVGSHIEVWARR